MRHFNTLYALSGGRIAAGSKQTEVQEANNNPRPRTAPHRSPTRPNYKEEIYKQSRVVLRYVGHPDHRARDRNESIGKNQ